MSRRSGHRAGQVTMLYKYRSLRTSKDREYARKMIVDGECFLSSIEDLNDPFDCRAQYQCNLKGEERKKFIESRLDELGIVDPADRTEMYGILDAGYNVPSILKLAMKQFFEDVGVFCMSQSRESVAMWSHYTDGHREICVGFDDAILRKEVQPQSFMGCVNYVPDVPVVEMGKFADGVPDLITSKGKEWQYEKETRVFGHDLDTRKFNTHSVKTVTLGCKILDNHRDEVTSWCDGLDPAVRIYQAIEVEDRYAIKFERVN